MALLSAALPLVIVAVVHAAPLKSAPASPAGCAIVVTRAEGLTADEAIGVATRVGDALRAAGIPVTLSASEVVQRAGDTIKGCAGKTECLAGVGRSLGAGAVVTADVSKVFDELALQLVLLDVAAPRSLGEKAYVGAPGTPAFNDALLQFAASARTALEKLPAFQGAPPADAPVVSQRTPPLTPAPTATISRPAPVAAIVTTGGAVATAAVAAYFGWSALGAWGRYQDQHAIVGPNGRDAVGGQLAGSGWYPMQRDAAIAGASTAVTAGLIAGAVYLWTHPGQ